MTAALPADPVARYRRRSKPSALVPGQAEDRPMPNEAGRMTADEFRAALSDLGETQASFARLLATLGDTAGDKVRTVQRWAVGDRDIPGPITALLTLLLAMRARQGIDTNGVRAWFQ